MTAEKKIDEAQYFLDHLLSSSGKLEFELSAFVTSARSVFDHLLQDFASRFSLGTLTFLSAQTFREKAERLHNQSAIDFIDWYEKEQTPLRGNNVYGFVFSLRDINIHRESLKQLLRITTTGPITVEAGTTVEIPLVFTPLGKPMKVEGSVRRGSEEVGRVEATATTAAYFTENQNNDVLTVCTAFLQAAKQFVTQAQSR